MPFNRRMDKENVVHKHNGAAEKNNDIMKFAGKWVDIENVILSEFWKSFGTERISENKYDLGIKIRKPALTLSPDSSQVMGMSKEGERAQPFTNGGFASALFGFVSGVDQASFLM
ncbi:hypothetical protein STEG23_034105 [Scotinomys teguina]